MGCCNNQPLPLFASMLKLKVLGLLQELDVIYRQVKLLGKQVTATTITLSSSIVTLKSNVIWPTFVLDALNMDQIMSTVLDTVEIGL